jgi:hypothetical protein
MMRRSAVALEGVALAWWAGVIAVPAVFTASPTCEWAIGLGVQHVSDMAILLKMMFAQTSTEV